MNPPFVEISLYFADGDPQAHLLDIVDVLLGAGGELEAVCLGSDEVARQATRSDLVQVRDAVRTGRSTISEIFVRKAIGLVRQAERVSLLDRLSLLRAPIGVKDNGDPSPIVIESEAETLGAHGGAGARRIARGAGRKVQRTLRLLVSKLLPSYAAVTVESPLATPRDSWLIRDPSSFENFYMSASFLGAARFRRLQEMVTNAVVEEVDSGLFVWCTEPFASGQHVERPHVEKLSEGVARLVRESARA
ncbi:MAG: hypothetical protein HYZ29_11770 [Myxococcales bacterium]|nr:hypothetical protein [Myxococcales bacterium]